MDSTNQTLVPVPFAEHPFTLSGIAPSNELAIHLHSEFSFQIYCEALFKIVLTIGLSEVPDFLNYQCQLVKNPISWLNSLDKLIKVNAELFNGKQAEHRHYKFISQIDIQRFSLQSSPLLNERIHHLRKLNSGSIDDSSFDTVYDFPSVLEKIKSYTSNIDKILFLQDRIFSYTQNSNIYLKTLAKPFDVLCQIEIDRLTKKEEMLLKIELLKLKPLSDTCNAEKSRLTSNLNKFVDVWYHFLHDKLEKGLPMVISTDKLIANLISNHFLDKNGKAISVKSVLTILEVNRPEKRPKADKRFNLD